MQVKLICIDRIADDDLMFDQSLIRSLQRSEVGHAYILVFGSGESIERGLKAHDQNFDRIDGVLTLSDLEARESYERLMRERGLSYVQLLTDVGLSSVGFFGADRGMLTVGGDDRRVVCDGSILSGLSRSGIFSVVMCAGRGPNGTPVDLHPLLCCYAIQEALGSFQNKIEAEIVVLAAKISASANAKMDNNESVRVEEIADLNMKIDPSTLIRAKKLLLPVYVTTVAKLEKFNAIAIKN